MTTRQRLDLTAFISRRSRGVDASGIRRVFDLGAKLKDPFNFSIGQPDFPVPDPIKQAAIDAITADRNGYTVTQGIPELLRRISAHLRDDVGWNAPSDDLGLLVTSGTSGAIFLAFLALLDAGDEAIIPDPWFVIYPHGVRMTGAKAVICDTYPDGRMTAEKIEPLITPRTKLVVIDSPGNPTGVVLSGSELREIVDLCERRNILLVSDEIYTVFTYDDALEDGACPTPARFGDQMLLVRGFGKSYGCTGWRLGYAAGPKRLIEEMAKLQQYTYVCAPSMAQAGVIAAFDIDMSEHVLAYRRKRDMVLSAMKGAANVIQPGGAFYCFIEVPPRLGMTATEFVNRAIERNVLIIPGNVFSQKDTHFRLSYATSDEKLAGGLAVLREMLLKGP
jgi:aspartate/methionine/tyrosine aminotransferase